MRGGPGRLVVNALAVETRPFLYLAPASSELCLLLAFRTATEVRAPSTVVPAECNI